MSWKSLVRAIAPTIGSALSGPLGGAATKFLTDAFLPDGDDSEGNLDKFLMSANPDALTKLKELELEFKAKTEALEVDVFKLEVADRESAREMAADAGMWPQIMFSLIFFVAYFGLIYSLFSGQIVLDDSIRDISNILIGVITASLPGIINFWFGSSEGSKRKTNKLSIK